jgi:hypothetical protein
MDNIDFKHLKNDGILEVFGEEKIEERYNKLYTEMNEFIDLHKLSSVARVNKSLLANVVLDYFHDIKRLKGFHNIDLANSQKVVAYTSFWLLRRKPIQIDNPKTENELTVQEIEKLTALNERFVLQYIFNYLSIRERKGHIFLRSNDSIGLKNFSAMMLYFLNYRFRDAQSLEMVITSFFAGQIYEQIDEDLSNVLHTYDHTK